MAKHILIIEDDRFFTGLISRDLIEAGFEVSQAFNSKEGVKKIRELKPDLVLCDLLLPDPKDFGNAKGEGAGFKIIEAAKADPVTASIPIIILSNFNEPEQIEKGMKLGASEYLLKSQFTTEEIIEKVKKLLG